MKRPSTTRQPNGGTPVLVVPRNVLAARAAQTRDLVARRAYELYQRRGGAHGHDLEDWRQAEAEILHSCHHDLEESRDAFVLRAEVPGAFTADQLQVSVEPRRVMVHGRIQVRKRGSGEGASTEQEGRRIFREHNLPAEVDPSRVTAVLKSGILEVVLPKVAARAARGAA